MDVMSLPNLAAYSAQVLCIAALGTVVSLVVRVDAAGVRYAYWRLLLALCLVLPWLQGRNAPSAAVPGSAGDGVTTISVVGSAPTSAGGAGSIDWVSLAIPVLAAGIVLRLLWLAVGLMLLRRMRRAGHSAPRTELVADVERAVGATADIRYVAGIDQPVTFGTLRPVVLLPEALRGQSDDIHRAVLCHELLHVRRRDWVFVLLEEAVRALLWFHPAIWWLIARVQLTREEVVDELTVLTTGRRRAYLEALLTFADDTPLAPAAAFARRRHLFHRMVLISREAVMSSRRIVLSCAAMALVVAVGSWSAVGAFPLTQDKVFQASAGPGPLEKSAKPVTPENPIPRRVNAVDPVHPAEAADTRTTVTLAVTLDELGRVAELRPTGINLFLADGSSMGYSSGTGSMEFREFLARSKKPEDEIARLGVIADAFVASAMDAVRQWRYDPPANAPLAFSVRLGYLPNAPVTTTQAAGIAEIPSIRAVRGGVGGGVGGGVAGGVGGRRTGAGSGSGSGAGAGGGVGAGAGTGQAPLRVGGNIAPPTKIRDVRPVYPDDARAARVQGVVIIEATVGPDGNVSEARVLRPIPMLDQAAVDAVMQWGFTPTLLNGVPVPVIMTVTVNFTLQ